MFPETTKHRLSPAYVRARELLARLPSGPVRGAEIGVFKGTMSAALLSRKDLSLVMVDSWAGDGADYMGQGDLHARLSQDQQDSYYKTTLQNVGFAGGRATIIRKSSLEAAGYIEDGSLDFVFIDADHSYEGCKADIQAWSPKLKPGGLLSGHDYDHPELPGVKRAVDEFCAPEVGKNRTWFRKSMELGHITSIAAMDDIRRNENVRRNCKRILKRVQDGIEPHNLVANLVCFGPSLAQTWPALLNRQDVYCVGAAHDFLVSKGIVPYASIDCDPRARVVDQITPHADVRYWLASCVDPSYIQKLRGFDVSLFHLHNGDNSAAFVWDIEPDAWLLVGGSSVGLRSVSLLYARGYRKFAIHGMDSSYLGIDEYAGSHVSQKPKSLIRVRPEGSKRWFNSNPTLIDYARQFLSLQPCWQGSSFELQGDGLLQEMVKCSKSS
jgi:hypothetical protein